MKILIILAIAIAGCNEPEVKAEAEEKAKESLSVNCADLNIGDDEREYSAPQARCMSEGLTKEMYQDEVVEDQIYWTYVRIRNATKEGKFTIIKYEDDFRGWTEDMLATYTDEFHRKGYRVTSVQISWD